MDENQQPKRIVGFKLSESVIEAIRTEALRKRVWPAHVVEELARKRFGLGELKPTRKARASA